ncbi:MAG: ABC transporter ATP-binding protein [Desulfobacteraceae bacterium]|jgi:branched-chain amino acid transport system ATP-binding protein
MLEVHHLNTFYGKIQVLWDVSLHIKKGEIVALIGANGAGKTTLVKTISGLLRPVAGSIHFLEKRIDGVPPHNIVNQGISHIPEGRMLFANMSILENLEMGAYPKHIWNDRHKILPEIFQLFPLLRERQDQPAGTLSGGEQQMVAMGRGLMSRPKLSLIDEPSAGLAPIVVDEIFQIIHKLRERGIAIFIIEQNVQQTLEIADRAYVLKNGRIVLSGTGKQLLQEKEIRKAYLGD